jgi:hypothetical protein
VHRGSAVVRGALLAVVIAAGMQLTASGVAGTATVASPGHVSVSLHEVDEGSTGNALNFSYARGSQRLPGGTVSVKVPAGWTTPQNSAAGSPGFVEANRGTIVIANRLVTVTGLTPCKACSLLLSYIDVTAPATLGPAIFVTKAAKPGQTPEKVRPAPRVMVKSLTVVTTTTTTTTTTSSTTTTTLPCDGQPATASSDGVTMTVTPGTCLIGGAVVALSGSGFDPSSAGIPRECNDDPSQPTVTLNVAGTALTLPVSCSGFAISHLIETTSSGDIPSGARFTVIDGTPGPPCGMAGDLDAICPVDSSGGNAAADAANYPCPPTPDQLAQGISCSLAFSDSVGKGQTVDLSFGAPSDNESSSG